MFSEGEDDVRSAGGQWYGRPDGGGLPTRRAFAVAAIVAAIAMIVSISVGVFAPRFASKPPRHLSLHDLSTGLIAGADTATPSPTLRNSPSPTGTLFSTPVAEHARAETTSTPPSASPEVLDISMNVDHTIARIADKVTYSVVARNVGAHAFVGALTVNLHTPKGTLRCQMTGMVRICTTPGDYDGSSSDPNAPHNNPPGMTRFVTIPSGRSLVLETLTVQVSANTAGTVLHNHAHVEGFQSTTTRAHDVTMEQIGTVKQDAPDVRVL